MFYILVIDDQQAMCDEIEEMFEDEFDNQVTTLKALNGEDGYEIFQSEDDIDLILIDIKNKVTKDSPQDKRAGSKIASNIRSSQKYQTTSPPIKFISGFEEFIEDYKEYEISDSDDVYDKSDEGFKRLNRDVEELLRDPLYRITYQVRKEFKDELSFIKDLDKDIRNQ